MTTVKRPVAKSIGRGSRIVVYGLTIVVLAVLCHLHFFSDDDCLQLEIASIPRQTTNDVCLSLLDALDARFDSQVNIRRSLREIENFDILEPEALCLTDERFGSENRFEALGDGPKFVCGVDRLAKQAPDCLIYSVGSDNKIDFERAAKLHLGCEIHTFDPSLLSPFVGDTYSTFHPWGIGIDGKVSKVKEVLTFASMSIEAVMKELGHTGRKLDILKIDCEGCEYGALPPLFEEIAKGNIQVDQIQVEMHMNFVSKWPYEMLRFMDAMDKADMKVFHKERNGWGCEGHKCVEYAIASRSFLRQVNAHVLCAKEQVESTAFGGWDQKVTKELQRHIRSERVKWYELSWSDLPTEMQKVAEELLFTADNWARDRHETIDWEELNPDQREAATKLGYEKK